MEARIARLETHVEHINANVADLRAGLARLEVKVDQGFASQDTKMEQGFARQDTKWEQGFAKVDAKLALQDEKMEHGFARLDAKIDRHFLILGGMIVSLGVGMAGLFAKGFHWL